MAKIDDIAAALADERAELARYVESAGGRSRIEGLHLARHDANLARRIKHFVAHQALAHSEVTVDEANASDDAMLAWAKINAPWYAPLLIDGPVDLADFAELIRRRRNLATDEFFAMLADAGNEGDIVARYDAAFALTPAERAVLVDYVTAEAEGISPISPKILRVKLDSFLDDGKC